MMFDESVLKILLQLSTQKWYQLFLDNVILDLASNQISNQFSNTIVTIINTLPRPTEPKQHIETSLRKSWKYTQYKNYAVIDSS